MNLLRNIKKEYFVFKMKAYIEVIKNHSDGYTTDSIIQLVIILADKIDIKKSRISEAGK